MTIGILVAWVDTPLSGDQKIYYAAARQADFQGNFPDNVHQAWELKPFGNRVAIYGVYKAATIFADFDDKQSFERAAQAVYGVVVIAVAGFFAYSLRRRIREAGFSPPLVFITLLVSFLTVSFYVSQEPEQTSILLVLVSAPMALAKSRRLNFLSGLPLALLFTLKGTTIFLAFPMLVLLYAMGDGYRGNLPWCLAGIIAWLVAVILALWLVYPQEIRDLRNATLVQSSFNITARFPAELAWAFWRNFHHVAVLLPGVVFAWLALPLFYWRKDAKNFLNLAAILAVGAGPMLIQGSRGAAADHYVLLVIPAIAAAILFYRATWDMNSYLTPQRIWLLALWSSGLVGVLVVLVGADAASGVRPPFEIVCFNIGAVFLGLAGVIGWLFLLQRGHISSKNANMLLLGISLLLMTLVWARYQTPWGLQHDWATTSEARQMDFKQLDQTYQLSSQSELLFLGNGESTYYLDAKSDCRYFFPIALYRALNQFTPGLKDSRIYKEQLNCALSYQGEYIVHDPDRMALKSFPRIEKKLTTEYRQLTVAGIGTEGDSITVWKRR